MDNNNTQLIDKYLTGMLSEEEELLFQEKLKDASFKEELNQMKLLKESITTFEMRRIKDLLGEEEKKHASTNTQQKSPQRKPRQLVPMLLKVAAVLIGVTGLIWWISTLNNNHENLFAQYFSPITNNKVVIDKSTPDSSILKQTFSYYENKEYKSALKGFKTIIANNDNDDYRFFQANAFLATHQTDQAITILTQIIQNKQSPYLDDAKWYLALAYLRKNQLSSAKPLLEMLLTHSFYGDKAKTILKALG